MAETTNTTSGTTTTGTASARSAAKPSTPRVTARKGTARKPTAARKTTPSKTTARATRTAARVQTGAAARANAAAAETTVKRGESLAERAALSYIGATLEARDRVIEFAGSVAETLTSPEVAERELKKLQARYELRGISARNQLERDVRRARTQLERVVRRNREAVERDSARRGNVVTARLAGVSGRVENVVQTGVATAERLGTIAKDRVAAIA